MRAFAISLYTLCFAAGCGANVRADSQPDAGTNAIQLGAECHEPGALACNGVAQKLQLLCDGTHWIQNGVCAGSMVCDPRSGPTVGSCQEPLAPCLAKGAGTSFCDEAVRKTCNADLLSTSDVTCKSAVRCASSTGPTCAACIDGEVSCDHDQLLECKGGAPTLAKKCASGTACDAKAKDCLPPICTPGQWRCAGSDLEQCSAPGTNWDSISNCSGNCNEAEHRCEACVPMTTDCLGDVPRTCSKTGSWTVATACASGCKDGACVDDPVTTSCKPGEYRCSGDALEQCLADGSGFTGTASCAPGTCDATTKSCGAGDCPTVGLRDCVGDTPRFCDDFHHYQFLMPCAGTTPVCYGGKCTEASVTKVMFPSKTSKTYDGASTSAPLNPTLTFFRKGSFVEESFPRTSDVSKLDASFSMIDNTDTTRSECVGKTIAFDVFVNLVKVGSFSFVSGASTSLSFSKSWSYPTIAPASGTVLIHYEAVTEIATGCGNWQWVPGGAASF